MLNKTISLILLLGLNCIPSLKAQYKSEVYSAYINNKMERWKNVIDKLEIIKNRSDELTLELLNYQYGYIGYCLEYNNKDEAKKYYNLAENNLETLEKEDIEKSIINAYKSAFYGFRISFNALTAPINGPKSLDYAKLALRQDSGNYLAYVQYANGYYNMPSAFGGSKKIALDYYKKARLILERNPVQNRENWNYLKLMTLVAQAYRDLGDLNSALKTYENILTIEPGFTYVRDEKYPELLKMK